jgi:outer membrane protein OmpA-like peptidoglycan-associated protein
MRTLVAFLACGFSLCTHAQTPAGYFVVISAYKSGQTAHAENLVEKIRAAGGEADYVIDPVRPFCYVYTHRLDDFETSIKKMKSVRAGGQYADAWVRILPAGQPVQALAPPPTRPEPAATVYVAIPREPAPPVPAPRPAPPAVSEEKTPPQPEKNAEPVIDNPPADPVYIPQTLKNTQIFLSLTNARNQKIIDGEVEVVDTERARSITRVKGNTYLSLPDPKSNSGQLTLICEAFGYRKTQHEINYKNTEADTLQPFVDLVGNFYLVRFDMVRLQKGDISVLYNVYFYNDAAIMRPESKFELNSLLDMLKENPAYKIVLHGHTNGNANGKIITMGSSQDFFNFNAPDRREGFGSSKQLSEARAEAIKDWLVAQGIAENRVMVRGWGGNRMLHDRHSVHARKNVRVEVEVLTE